MNKRREIDKYKYEYLYRINMHQMSRIIPSKGMNDIANKRYSKGLFFYIEEQVEQYKSILKQKYRRISFRKKLRYFNSNKEKFKEFFNKSNIYTKIEKVDRNYYQITNRESYQYTNPSVPKSMRKMSFSVFMTILGLTYKTKKRHSEHLLTPADRKRLNWNKR